MVGVLETDLDMLNCAALKTPTRINPIMALPITAPMKLNVRKEASTMSANVIRERNGGPLVFCRISILLAGSCRLLGSVIAISEGVSPCSSTVEISRDGRKVRLRNAYTPQRKYNGIPNMSVQYRVKRKTSDQS